MRGGAFVRGPGKSDRRVPGRPSRSAACSSKIRKCGEKGVCRDWSERRAGRRRPAATACETLAEANGDAHRTVLPATEPPPHRSMRSVAGRRNRVFHRLPGRVHFGNLFSVVRILRVGPERRPAARLPATPERRMQSRPGSRLAAVSMRNSARVSTRLSRGGSLTE